MNNKITEGRYLAQKILEDISKKIQIIKSKPKLAIILVGNDRASTIYVKNKLKAAKEIGLDTIYIPLSDSIDIDYICTIIDELNDDTTISGIIVQLPLPPQINKNIIFSRIDPNKDVDGLHPLNVGRLHLGLNEGFIPCTALGCLALIKHQLLDLSGLTAVILSRSSLVGRPLSALLLKENITVTICHSQTKNLITFTKNADIVITAIGVPNFLTEEYFSPNSIVIDVGISKLEETNTIVGDVDFKNVSKKVRYISSVPGGVGPLTIAYLLYNTFKAFVLQNQLTEF